MRAARLPFASVNRPGRPGHAADLQRHHLLPRQAIGWPSLQRMVSLLGRDRIGFDDFRRNGMLLPSRESAAVRLGLPLHLGPHRDYNRMVIERLGTIEAAWAQQRVRRSDRAIAVALMRIGMLQSALRRRLLDRRRPMQLNRHDTIDPRRDFTMLDKLAEDLWSASAV